MRFGAFIQNDVCLSAFFFIIRNLPECICLEICYDIIERMASENIQEDKAAGAYEEKEKESYDPIMCNCSSSHCSIFFAGKFPCQRGVSAFFYAEAGGF